MEDANVLSNSIYPFLLFSHLQQCLVSFLFVFDIDFLWQSDPLTAYVSSVTPSQSDGTGNTIVQPSSLQSQRSHSALSFDDAGEEVCSFFVEISYLMSRTRICSQFRIQIPSPALKSFFLWLRNFNANWRSWKRFVHDLTMFFLTFLGEGKTEGWIWWRSNSSFFSWPSGVVWPKRTLSLTVLIRLSHDLLRRKVALEIPPSQYSAISIAVWMMVRLYDII